MGRGGLGLLGTSLGDSQLVRDPGLSWPRSGEAEADRAGEAKMESIEKLDIFLFSVDISVLINHCDFLI